MDSRNAIKFSFKIILLLNKKQAATCRFVHLRLFGALCHVTVDDPKQSESGFSHAKFSPFLPSFREICEWIESSWVSLVLFSVPPNDKDVFKRLRLGISFLRIKKLARRADLSALSWYDQFGKLVIYYALSFYLVTVFANFSVSVVWNE